MATDDPADPIDDHHAPHHLVRWIVLGSLLAVVVVVAFVVLRREQSQTEAVDTFCTRLAAVTDLDATLVGGDPGRLEAQRASLAAAAAAAPDPIAAQIRLLRDVTDDIATTVGTVRDPTVAAEEVAQRRRDQLGDIAAAGAAVQAYARDTCGLTLGTPGSAPGSVPGSTATSSTATSSTPPSSRPTSSAPVRSTTTPSTAPTTASTVAPTSPTTNPAGRPSGGR